MKKIIMLMMLSIFVLGGAFAQTPVDLDSLQTTIEDLNGDLASAVPFAATLGGTWSDAYIGQILPFPHFGVGAFGGAVIIPAEGFDTVLEVISPEASIPDEVASLGGVPFPVIGGEARIGGFLFPFDLGVKYATFNAEIGDAAIDYTMLGADVRVPILKGGLVLPKVSIGLGYNYLSTDMTIAGLLGGDFVILDTTDTSKYPGLTADQRRTLILQDPDFNYGWESHVFEAKAQVSKGLLLFTPYAGASMSYGMSTIGGGVKTTVTDGTNPISQDDIDTATDAAGVPSVDTSGFIAETEESGLAFKLYGGFSFNILVLKTDIGVSYNVLSGAYAGQLGLRVQL